MAVAEPFGRGLAQRVRLERIAEDAGARLVKGTLAEVDDADRTAITGAGDRLDYDALVVAVGARAEPALQRAPDLDARGRRRGLRRAAARHRRGLQQAGRVRRARRRRLAAPRVRARADDRLAGGQHGPRRPRDHDLHARERAARGLRRRGHDRAARGPRRRRHRGGDRRVRAGRRGRAAGRRAGRAAARQRARGRASARDRPGAQGAPVRRARLHHAATATARSTAPRTCGPRAMRSRSRSSRAGLPLSRPSPPPKRSRPGPART